MTRGWKRKKKKNNHVKIVGWSEISFAADDDGDENIS